MKHTQSVSNLFQQNYENFITDEPTDEMINPVRSMEQIQW